jgi:phosphate-selective porin OprO and OprP
MVIAHKVYQLNRLSGINPGPRGRMPREHIHPTLWKGLLLLAAASPAAQAQQDTARGSTTARLEELEQRVRILGRLRELEADSAGAAAQARATVGIGDDGFTFRSADGRWRLRVGGYFQADGRYYLRDAQALGTNSLVIRRARPIVEGTVYQYFDFRIMPDFGTGQPTIYEAYLETRLDPALAFRAGKFKPPVGLERLQSATDLRFVERGFPTNLVPNRDVGFQASGEVSGGMLSYAAGVFNGVVDLGFGDVDASDAKEVAARVFTVPFVRQGRRAPLDLGVGLSGSIGTERGTPAAPATSALRTPGQLPAFRYRSNGTVAATVVADGSRFRVEPQAYLYRGSFGLLAQYTVSRHTVRRDSSRARIRHYAWQVAGSFFLTGERPSFRGMTPKRLFEPRAGSWGALELAARIQETGVADSAFPLFADPAVSARRIRAWALGLNWHFARGVKLMLDYERATFVGGAAGGGNRLPEHFLATRLQTSF